MRLALMLCRKKMPNGHIWRGKDRLYFNVGEKGQETLRKQYEVENQNMYYLRHPYLTFEQSCGHAKALGKAEQWREKWRAENRKFKDPVTLESRLGHLRVKEAWD